MAEYWQLTIDVLQDPNEPIVDKPKLSEKLLTKPPFRFLHDVVSAVQRNTGFAPNLFQGDELDSKSATLQDKDAKVAYLTKIINVVSIALGQACPAKPLKIVAGLEPENTNVFLQMLASACRQGPADDAVQRVLGGEEPGSAPAPSAAKPAKSSKSAALPPEENDVPPPPADKPKRRSKPAEEAPPAPEPEPEERPRGRTSSSSGKPPAAAAAAKQEVEEAPPSRSSAAEPSMQRTSGRPMSARKAPPKLSTGSVVSGSGPSIPSPTPAAGRRAGAGSGGLLDAAPVANARSVTLLEEGIGGKDDDDDDVEVIREQAPVAIGMVPGGEQGVLVKNILQAEKDLKKAKDEGGEEGGGGGGTGIILGRLGGARGAGGGGGAQGGGVKSVDSSGIRDLVQKLCQSSHPLAKSMDYMQEDLENMSKEYRFWVTERRVAQDRLGEEQRMAVDQAAADARLADLEGQIRQVRDRTIGLKAQVLRNDETITKLLSMAVSGGR